MSIDRLVDKDVLDNLEDYATLYSNCKANSCRDKVERAAKAYLREAVYDKALRKEYYGYYVQKVR